MVQTSILRVLAIIVVCTALVSAQTFQYSRGWTNGRKRSGVMLVAPRLTHGHTPGQRAAALAAAAALLEDAGLQIPSPAAPCQQYAPVTSSGGPATVSEESMQRIRAVLDNLPIVSQETEGSAERRRRDAADMTSAASSPN